MILIKYDERRSVHFRADLLLAEQCYNFSSKNKSKTEHPFLRILKLSWKQIAFKQISGYFIGVPTDMEMICNAFTTYIVSRFALAIVPYKMEKSE